MDRDIICIRRTNGEAEAQQIQSFLEANGIASELRGQTVRLTHGFPLDRLGSIQICVAAEEADRARELLEDADEGRLQIDESAAAGQVDDRAIEPD